MSVASKTSSRGSRRRSSGSIVPPKGPVFGIIGGSSLLRLNDTTTSTEDKDQKVAQQLANARVEDVETPLGRVVYRICTVNDLQHEHQRATLVFIQRHQANTGERYTQPADINYGAIAMALKALVRALD